MPESPFQKLYTKYERSRSRYVIGAVLLLLLSVGIFYLVLIGKTRQPDVSPVIIGAPATTTVELVARHLDGVLVPVGQEALTPRAVMIENFPDARPLSGLSKANVVIEAPVEGGITRFMALFDATTTVAEAGPVRSARPYYVDWAQGWKADYFHVGGSPDALDKIKAFATSSFGNFDEMARGQYFWRSQDRLAPHNTYTSNDLMNAGINAHGVTSTAPISWHFQDAATSTDAFGKVALVKITYGGSYNVNWKFDATRNVYVRYQGALAQLDKDGSPVESENVVVLKTDGKVLDEKGRLSLKTIGSGDAVAYRDGKKFVERWSRSNNEPIKFNDVNGSDFLLNRGRTWVEVTTDDKVFAGL